MTPFATLGGLTSPPPGTSRIHRMRSASDEQTLSE